MNIFYSLLLLLLTNNINNDYILDEQESTVITHVEITKDEHGRVAAIDIFYDNDEYFEFIADEEDEL